MHIFPGKTKVLALKKYHCQADIVYIPFLVNFQRHLPWGFSATFSSLHYTSRIFGREKMAVFLPSFGRNGKILGLKIFSCKNLGHILIIASFKSAKMYLL